MKQAEKGRTGAGSRRMDRAAVTAIAADEPIAVPPRRFTLDGDADVEGRIAADQRRAAEAVAEAVSEKHLIALALTGSYGRGDGGHVIGPDGPLPHNGYHYLVIVHGLGRKQRDAAASRLSGAAQRLKRTRGVAMDFRLLPLRRLRRLDPSLANAEMRWGHRVITGDSSILGNMPEMPFHTIAPGEITRRLLNRGSLLLMNARRLRRRRRLPEVERQDCFERLLAAVLGCGDAWLARAGCYHPSYPVKRERIEALGQPRPGVEAAADWRRFLELYRLAYRHRLHPVDGELADAEPAEWQSRAVRLWLSALRGFEQQRLGAPFGNWIDYCDARVPKGQPGGTLRNMTMTIRDFGLVEPLRRPVRARRHPRERLIATLPLLLGDPGDRPDPCVADALALASGSDWAAAAEAFLARREHHA